MEGGYPVIEGWLQTLVVWALGIVSDYHEKHDISGDICEIGIHHGRFFLALENASRPTEKCIAIDIFERQTFNVDRSGKGDEEIFRSNVAKYAAHPSRVIIKPIDSTSIEARRYFQSCDPIRLFSVDGGHTPQHVINDLRLAEASLADGGVIFLDDYCNPAWPGVNEGLFRYLDGDTTLVPIISLGGKLLLSGVSWHSAWLAWLKGPIKQSGYRAKIVRLHGGDLWHVWK